MTPALLIRIAMLIGVLLFGAVTWFLRQSGNAPEPPTPESARTLLWMGRAAWGAAVAGCVVLFALLQRETTPARAQRLSIIAWALGELVALFGGVVWFLTGLTQWYVSGLVFLVLALLAFPGGGTRRAGRRA